MDKADEYLWDAGPSAWVTCKVCGEEYSPEEDDEGTCDECLEKLNN